MRISCHLLYIPLIQKGGNSDFVAKQGLPKNCLRLQAPLASVKMSSSQCVDWREAGRDEVLSDQQRDVVVFSVGDNIFLLN